MLLLISVIIGIIVTTYFEEYGEKRGQVGLKISFQLSVWIAPLQLDSFSKK